MSKSSQSLQALHAMKSVSFMQSPYLFTKILYIVYQKQSIVILPVNLVYSSLPCYYLRRIDSRN